MSEFSFVPNKDQLVDSNIFRFMKKLGINSLDELSKRSKDYNWFWQKVDEDLGIVWDKKYTIISDTSQGIPWTKWFVDGKLNIIKSTVEKFAKKTPDKIAYYFVSEKRRPASITYRQLDSKVSQLSNALIESGIQKGDVIAIYMPMISDAIVTILACAKIGVIQTVIFSGYGAESLHVRLIDSKAKMLFASDGFFRKGKSISQKDIIIESIKNTDIQKVIISQYSQIDSQYDDRFEYFHEFTKGKDESCQCTIMDSEDPLFILYTSGTTGKPKGVIHTHGGITVFAGHQSRYLIDTTQNDVLFWPADIGWITGMIWNVYGLLECGASAVIYDGALDWPDICTVWSILEKYKVTIFGISPTAIRMFKKNIKEELEQYDLTNIKNIPVTGEPIDIDSWNWIFNKIGKGNIPVMNLAGGTEIGGAMLSVFPGMSLKPTTVGIPCPGIDVDVVNDNAESLHEKKGYLVIKSPWPAMSRGLLGDADRYIKTYWSRFENMWFHGDYVLVDKDGLWYMHGRVDDVVNISGHRISTAEIEQVVILEDYILEAAAVSIPDEITGDALVVFVVPEKEFMSENIEDRIKDVISKKIGKLARPKMIMQISDLPKTSTGKITRRLLQSKILGKDLGDVSAIENVHVLDEIKSIIK